MALVGLAVGAGATLAGIGVGQAEESALDFILSEARRVAPFLGAARPQAPVPAPAPAGFAEVASASRTFDVPARRATAGRFVVLAPASGLKPAARAEGRSDARSTRSWGETTPTLGRTVCVRTCDGYAFPLGDLSARADLTAHEAGCAAACPGAPTALYTLPRGGGDLGRDLRLAVNLSGRTYDQLPTAGLHQRRRVEACSCAGGAVPLAMTPIPRDATLRVGDVVARVEGAAALVTGARGARFVDFRRAGALSAGTRRDVDRVTGTTRREVARAEFARLMRARHAASLAGQEGARIRVASASDSFSVLAAPAGFGPVRVVLPYPYRTATP